MRNAIIAGLIFLIKFSGNSPHIKMKIVKNTTTLVLMMCISSSYETPFGKTGFSITPTPPIAVYDQVMRVRKGQLTVAIH